MKQLFNLQSNKKSSKIHKKVSRNEQDENAMFSVYVYPAQIYLSPV